MSRSKKNWDHLVDARGNYKDFSLISNLPKGTFPKGGLAFDKGEKGEKGNQGTSVKGDKGDGGVAGPKGKDGESVLDILEKGGVVPKGTTPGELADFLKGEKGYRGEKGEKGLKGLGDKGQKGQKGDAKQILTFQGEVADEASLGSVANPQNGDVYLTQDTGTLFAYADGNWVALNGVAAPIKGEKGESIKGDKGFKGNKGESLLETLEKGNVIPKGSTPDDLATFLKGEKGLKGDDGEKGLTGSGDKGDQGIKGEKGETGSKGSKGEEGDDVLDTLIDGGLLPKGSTPGDLANYLKGDTGATGNKGEKGEKGEEGSAAPLFEYQGDVADTSALPAAGSGNVGHVYYVTDVDKYVVSDGTSWRNMDSPGLTPNLQQVTDSGATTDKNIQIGSQIKLDTGTDVHELEAFEGNIDPLNSWIYTTPPGSGSIHGAMASTNGTWIAVRETGSPDIIRSTDDGNSWTTVRNVSNQGWLYVDTDDAGVWCACSYNGRGIYRSEDDGLTWSATNVTSGTWQQVKTNNSGVWMAVASSGQSIWKSVDNGKTWQNTGVGTFPCKAIHYNNTNHWIACGFMNGVIKKSYDNGATWIDGSNGFPVERWYDISYGNGVWVAVNDSASNATGNRVYVSTTGGSWWDWATTPSAGLWQSIATDQYGNWIIRSINRLTAISTNNGVSWTDGSGVESSTSYQLFYKNAYWGMASGAKLAKLATDRASIDAHLKFNDDLIATRNNIQPLIDALNTKVGRDAIIQGVPEQGYISTQSQFNSWVAASLFALDKDLKSIFEGRIV